MFFSVLLIVLTFHLYITINDFAGADSCPPINVDKANCSYCISRSYKCHWCVELKEQFANLSLKERCGERHQLERKCRDGHIISRPTEDSDKINLIRDHPLSPTIQLKPQKVLIALSPQQEVRIPISYKRSKDHPMDLYYLMDLSCTMKNHKEVLGQIGERLMKAMNKITKNPRFGFGSYVDKPVMPYSAFNIEPVRCKNTDSSTQPDGEPPYSFRHITFTNKSEEFSIRVNQAQLSGNTDSPEGALDALMQVLVCGKEIGWRDKSQKIIVVVTDEEFHIAGDGKLAGILTPNDGKCHMSPSDGSSIRNYMYYNLTDYPSMYQIKDKAKGFSILFSVTKEVEHIYTTLKNIIGPNAEVAPLKINQDIAIKLIEDLYKRITTNVMLTVSREKSEFVQVTFRALCDGYNWVEASNCQFKEIKEIQFEAIIKLIKCPNLKTQWNEKFKIEIQSDNELIDIELKMLCECDCDVNGFQKDSPECSSNGTLACGICRECNGIRTGDKCECDPEKPRNPNNPDGHCKIGNDTRICSGRSKATCGCNKCECNDKGYSGKYCEIEEYRCYPDHDLTKNICNGNGRCNKDGKCDCFKGFIGTYCDCPLSNDTCTKQGTQEVCSGVGKCVCGKCKCNDHFTKGDFCQFCPSCEANEICNKTVKCVQKICETIYGIKENCSEDSMKKCFDFRHELVKELNTTANLFTYQCRFQTPDNECAVEFRYERTDRDQNGQTYSSFRIAHPFKNCAKKTDLVVVGSSVIAGTILVGLALLLIWKLLTEIWDRKEYSRFQKELSKANWGQSENPLYKEAKSTFQNPMFALRDRAQKRLSRLTERFSRRFDFNPNNN